MAKAETGVSLTQISTHDQLSHFKLNYVNEQTLFYKVVDSCRLSRLRAASFLGTINIWIRQSITFMVHSLTTNIVVHDCPEKTTSGSLPYKG